MARHMRMTSKDPTKLTEDNRRAEQLNTHNYIIFLPRLFPPLFDGTRFLDYITPKLILLFSLLLLTL